MLPFQPQTHLCRHWSVSAYSTLISVNMACTMHGAKMPGSLKAPHVRSTSTCRPLYLRSRSAPGPIRCHAYQGSKQLGQSMAAALAAAVLMVQPAAAASLKESASGQLEKTTTQLEVRDLAWCCAAFAD